MNIKWAALCAAFFSSTQIAALNLYPIVHAFDVHHLDSAVLITNEWDTAKNILTNTDVCSLYINAEKNMPPASRTLQEFESRYQLAKKASHVPTSNVDCIIVSHDNCKSLDHWYKVLPPGGFLFFTYQPSSEIQEWCTHNNIIPEEDGHIWCYRKPHLLSLIIATCNNVDTIKNTLQSIYVQNIDMPFEVICHDDNSKDGTQAVLHEYANLYDNCHIHNHSRHKGKAAVLRDAIDEADGNLLFTIDPHTILPNGSIMHCVTTLEATEAHAAYIGQHKYFTHNPGDLKKSWCMKSCHSYYFELQDLFSIPHNIHAFDTQLCTRKLYEKTGGYKLNTLTSWSFGVKQLTMGMPCIVVPDSVFWRKSVPNTDTEKQQKVLNATGFFIAKKWCAEFITDETRVHLFDDQKNGILFFDSLDAKRYTPLPSRTIDLLAKARRHKRANRFHHAFALYQQAISMGSTHHKVYKEYMAVKSTIVERPKPSLHQSINEEARGFIPRALFLTFVIPAYNHAEFLSEAIDSIYAQQLEIPFEVICVDDASNDKKAEILKHYEEKYESFQSYRLEENKDASYARNFAIEHAQGDLIFNLDADNVLMPKSIQGLIELLDTSGFETASFK